MTTKAQIQAALDAEQFKQWLQAHPDATMLANHTDKCPIACYLKDVLQAENISVYHDHVSTPVTAVWTDESWAAAFVELIDGDAWDTPTISAESALHALDEVVNH